MRKSKRDQAHDLYLDGKNTAQIAASVDVAESTVRSWKSRYGWETYDQASRIIKTLEQRVYDLAIAEPTQENLHAMRQYGIELRRYQVIQAKLKVYKPHQSSTRDKNFNKKLSNRGRKSNAENNYLPPDAVAALVKAHQERMFKHQAIWDRASQTAGNVNPFTEKPSRILNLMKSRQVGATDWKSHHSCIAAADEGRNQNFLSASRSQALLFRGYIQKFVYEQTGIELKGGGDASPMVIRTDDHPMVEMRFLSASSNSAQGPHGDTINDEYFWQRDFERLRRVSSAMATHTMWRQYYISTPSTVNHPAYAFWTGEHANRGRRDEDMITLDVSHKALKHGRHCEDSQWRQIVTLDDAVTQGFDMADPDLLRIEYPPDEYRNLFECKFIDDSASVFKLEMIQPCMLDTLELSEKGHRMHWLDFDPDKVKPFGNKPVWVGFDPSRTRDASAIVIVAPPDQKHPNFRVLDKFQWHNMAFEYQAYRLKELCDRYNVKRIAIDTTGMGQGVYERTKEIIKNVRIKAIHYSAESKAELVTKGVDVFHNKRIEFDSGWTDLAKALMTIYQTVSTNNVITYKARRTNTTGHADLAFALLHALSFEPLSGRRKRGRAA